MFDTLRTWDSSWEANQDWGIPQVKEQVEDRVERLLAIYDRHGFDGMSDADAKRVQDYFLEQGYSY